MNFERTPAQVSVDWVCTDCRTLVDDPADGCLYDVDPSGSVTDPEAEWCARQVDRRERRRREERIRYKRRFVWGHR